VNSVANVCGCDVLGLLREEIVLNGGRAQQSTKRAKEIAERCSAELGDIIFSIELVRRASSESSPWALQRIRQRGHMRQRGTFGNTHQPPIAQHHLDHGSKRHRLPSAPPHRLAEQP
jgi:hypothetical protein